MEQMDLNKYHKSEDILKGLTKALHKLIEYNRKMNIPLVVSENGKVVYLDCNKINLDSMRYTIPETKL